MVPPAPTPSARLVRAAAAEREHLRRHRDELLAARDRLRAELASVEASLEDLAERDALLDRLAGPAGQRSAPALAAVPRSAPEAGTPGRAAGAAGSRGAHAAEHAERPPLRGPAIRRAAVQALLEHPRRPDALHYREWFQAVCASGHTVAGKDPLAVFLTQLGRSPVIRKGTQSGVYELDRTAPRRLRGQLDALHEQLRALTASPGAAADLAAVRARRAEITTAMAQTEKALEEAEAVLVPPARPVAVAR
jgi:prefoldin subunit 5